MRTLFWIKLTLERNANESEYVQIILRHCLAEYSRNYNLYYILIVGIRAESLNQIQNLQMFGKCVKVASDCKPKKRNASLDYRNGKLAL